MSEKRLYTVVVNRDDTVRVESVAVLRETPQFYFIESKNRDLRWADPEYQRRDAFGYSDRVPRERFRLSAKEAIRVYMQRRQRDKDDALTVAGQATKQIASANELLHAIDVQSPAETMRQHLDSFGERHGK